MKKICGRITIIIMCIIIVIIGYRNNILNSYKIKVKQAKINSKEKIEQTSSIEKKESKLMGNSKEDIYDVILFWGQSNMVCYCGRSSSNSNEFNPDARYDYTDSESVSQFSLKTGIDSEYLSNAVKMNFVKINQEPQTAYDYKYISNTIEEITEDTQYIGEYLQYNTDTKDFKQGSKQGYNIEKTAGTNMIPAFCKEYYKKTGRKVVAVLVANGGKAIEKFLPSTDSQYNDPDNNHLYESMVTKYNAAIKYMEDNGYTVQNKIWVSFQGESNTNANVSTEDYKNKFTRVIDNLKTDTNITNGAIVETSYELNYGREEYVEKIHKAQEEIALERDDIIIGSTYAYDRFIPLEKNYNENTYINKCYLDSDGNKLPYNTAFEQATCSVCYPNNTIHFTSSALCQIGKETAESLAKFVTNNSGGQRLNKDDRVIFFNTENGLTSDCILIQSQEKYGLIDTANRKSASIVDYDGETIQLTKEGGLTTDVSMSNGEDIANYIKNVLKIDHLDFVIATHAHSDHIGGLEAIANSGLVNSSTKLFYKTYSHNKFDRYYDDDLPEDTLMSFGDDGKVMFYSSTTGEIKENVQRIDNTNEEMWHNQAFLYAGITEFIKNNGKIVDVSSKIVLDENNQQTKFPDISKITNDKVLQNAEFNAGDRNNYYDDYISFDFGNFNIKLFNLYVNTHLNNSDNGNSIVALITNGSKKFVSWGDMNVDNQGEQKVARVIKNLVGTIDLIKPGHHATPYRSNTLELYDLLQPKFSVNTRKCNTESKENAFFQYYSKEKYATIFYEVNYSEDGIVVTFENDKLIFNNLYSDENKVKIKEIDTCINNRQFMSGWLESQKNFPREDTSDCMDYAYFDDSGEPTLGWLNKNNRWYYLGEYGVMKSGWVLINNSEWYYFSKEKVMSEDTIVCQYGEMLKGWQKLPHGDNQLWYYFATKGDSIKKDETSYYKEGQLITGWHDIEYEGKNYTFYFETETKDDKVEGAMATGRRYIEKDGEGNYYYFAKSSTDVEGYCTGAMVSNTTVDGYRYNENGQCINNDRIHFTYINSFEEASSAEAILIESNGHYGLIDTLNPSSDNSEDKDTRNHSKWNNDIANGKTIVEYLDKIGVKQLDFVLVTHCHSDHIGGIPDICNAGNYINSNTTFIYKNYIGNTIEDEKYNNKDYYDLAIEALNKKNVKMLDVTQHTDITNNMNQIDKNAKFVENANGEKSCDYIEFTFQNYDMKIFNLYNANPEESENNNSLVTLIEKENKKVLLMSEIPATSGNEQKISEYIGHVNLAKIGHYDAATYTSLKSLNSITPETVILTGGKSGKKFKESFRALLTYFNENDTVVYGNEDMQGPILAEIEDNNIKLYNYDTENSLVELKEEQQLHTDVTQGWQKICDNSNIIWTYINAGPTFARGWNLLEASENDTTKYWFYFQEETTNTCSAGVMLTDWQKIKYNGKEYWFYFNTETKNNNIKGAMATGRRYIEKDGEGNYYYFAKSSTDVEGYCTGAMVTNATVDGYRYDENGICIGSNEITSQQYTVNQEKQTVSGIKPETTVAELKRRINNEMEYVIKDKNNNTLKETDKLGTGYKIVMADGKEYKIAVLGDINGDAKISIIDVARLQKISARIITASDIETMAGDLNQDNKISIIDLARMQKLATGQNIFK